MKKGDGVYLLNRIFCTISVAAKERLKVVKDPKVSESPWHCCCHQSSTCCLVRLTFSFTLLTGGNRNALVFAAELEVDEDAGVLLGGAQGLAVPLHRVVPSRLGNQVAAAVDLRHRVPVARHRVRVGVGLDLVRADEGALLRAPAVHLRVRGCGWGWLLSGGATIGLGVGTIQARGTSVRLLYSAYLFHAIHWL